MLQISMSGTMPKTFAPFGGSAPVTGPFGATVPATR